MENELKEYKNKIDEYEGLTNEVERLLKSFLKDDKINYHLIESRTKTLVSFEDKIKRKGNKYEDPLNDITDICGVRIILYYQDQINHVIKILKENFIIDEEHTVDKSQLLKDDQFGYNSPNYMIMLDSNRTNLKEWMKYKNRKIEVQIKTVLQHAWASISHSIEYKNKQDIPNSLRRKLYRLAGLFELVDEQFLEIRTKNEEITEEIYDVDKLNNNLDYDELNLLTLRKYFEEKNDVIENLIESATKAGFLITGEIFQKYLSQILKVASILNINSLSAFNLFIKQRLHLAEVYLAQIFSNSSNPHLGWTSFPDFTTLLFLLCFLEEGQLEEFGGEGWAKNTWYTTCSTIVNKIYKMELR